MLLVATDALNTDSPPVSPVPLTAATSTQLIGLDAGDPTPGIGQSYSTSHNGVQITADTANTAVLYLRLGGVAASATAWHIALPAGASWGGTVGGVVWRGAVQGYSAAAASAGVAVA
jgi:hypothetical protein